MTSETLILSNFKACASPPDGAHVETGPHDLHINAGSLVIIRGGSAPQRRLLLYSIAGKDRELFPRSSRRGCVCISRNGTLSSISSEDCFVLIDNPYTQLSGLKDRVADEVALPLEMKGIPRRPMQAAVDFALAVTGLIDRSNHRLAWLSGGELERLHLACAIVSGSEIIVLDHALSELDPGFRTKLLIFLRAFSVVTDAFVIIADDTGVDDRYFDMVISLGDKYTPKEIALPAARSTRPVFEIRNLTFVFSRAQLCLFDGLTFELCENETLFLLGPNGSGKSTLGRLVLNDVEEGAYSGDVLLVGRPILDVPLSELRRNFNCAFQNPDLYFCRPSVDAELRYGITDSYDPGCDRMVELLGLGPFLPLNPFDLDHGARKRLSIALAARDRPKVLFLDEPSQYQDDWEVDLVARALAHLASQGTGTICATHDLRLIQALPEARKITLSEPLRKFSTTQQSTHTPSDGSPVERGRKASLVSWVEEAWRIGYVDWLASLTDIIENWSERIYPLFDQLSNALSLNGGNDLIDLGCGCGWQTAYFVNRLRRSGLKLRNVVGIDQQSDAIEFASFLTRRDSRFRFIRGDVCDYEAVRAACEGALQASKVDFVFSSFLFHDVPAVAPLLKTIYAMLSETGKAVCIFLNPNWVEIQGEKKLKRLEWTVTEEIDFQFAGIYYLTKNGERRAGFPYFHRSMLEYGLQFQKCGLRVRSGWSISSDRRVNAAADWDEVLERVAGPEAQSITLVLEPY